MIGFTPAQTLVNRVLVVEDDRDEVEFLKEFFSSKGMDVDIARDGGQARAAFNMHQPDMVILDLILPNVTGFEVCEQLKRLNDSVPVLILTAIDMEDARDLARRCGSDGYMTKPYDPDELMKEMRRIAEDLWAREHLEEEQEAPVEKVRFECTECGKRLKVSGSHRGRTLNCPRCGQPVTVPRNVG
jgi:two-component system, OmpR family, response regulator